MNEIDTYTPGLYNLQHVDSARSLPSLASYLNLYSTPSTSFLYDSGVTRGRRTAPGDTHPSDATAVWFPHCLRGSLSGELYNVQYSDAVLDTYAT